MNEPALTHGTPHTLTPPARTGARNERDSTPGKVPVSQRGSVVIKAGLQLSMVSRTKSYNQDTRTRKR